LKLTWTSLFEKNVSIITEKQLFLVSDSGPSCPSCRKSYMPNIARTSWFRMYLPELHKKSIIQSPLCLCGEKEKVHHFFCSCPRSDILKSTYLRHLPCPLALNNLLYGDERLGFNTNEKLINRYILKKGKYTRSPF
jgi:hypothetical protein